MPYIEPSLFEKLTDLLDDNLTAWEGEENSVRGEHCELIDKLQRFELKTEPLRVFVVEGEHPFDPYYPTDLFLTREGADHRAADLTRSFLEAYWAIKYDDENDKVVSAMPIVTPHNWLEIVETYGNDDDFVQTDQWGRWWVEITEKEVIDG